MYSRFWEQNQIKKKKIPGVYWLWNSNTEYYHVNQSFSWIWLKIIHKYAKNILISP